MADGGRLCRSEPAREKPEGTTGFQAPRVIVDDHREQARAHRGIAVCQAYRYAQRIAEHP